MAAPEERELTAEQTEKLLQFQVLYRGHGPAPPPPGYCRLALLLGAQAGSARGESGRTGCRARAGLGARGESPASVPWRGWGCSARDSLGDRASLGSASRGLRYGLCPQCFVINGV